MKQTLSPTQLQAMAVRAARRGGTHACTNKLRRSDVHKQLAHDVKLQLDLECQEIIQHEILSTYPDHTILGEEDTHSESSGGGEYEWIVDPIDGTVNFSHNQLIWCCSVAVRKSGHVLAGAVYAPELNLLFEASTDTPALCNGDIIEVSKTTDLKRSLVFTGADKDEERDDAPFRFFLRISQAVQRPRISGSAALDICQVAAGRADGYFEPKIYIWDIAAAGLILQQAGGTVQPLWLRSGHRMACLATNGTIHAPLRNHLSSLLPD